MEAINDICVKLEEVSKRANNLVKPLAIAEKKQQLEELTTRSQVEGFWDNRESAEQVSRQRDRLQKLLDVYETMLADIDELQEFVEVLSGDDTDLVEEIVGKLSSIEKRLDRLEFRRMFRHEADPNSAVLSINSGAGGTEAQDWVSMLLRMYMRWCEQQGFKVELVDSLAGEEAGYKSATITVDGDYAYGHLKAEAGIHRLVRISPFDANSRRHTSFASISVSPEVTDDIDIEISESDLRIDTYRASGAGGQHINKTDSAVRITHQPTGIVVQCQNERSQHKNKATCMKILKSRLYELELKKREEAMNKLHGEKKDIAWGSQIRSYVLHPYRMVKDHRTKLEVGNVDAVLNGELTPFMEALLLSSEGKENQ